MSRSESYIYLIYGIRVSPREAKAIDNCFKEIAIKKNIHLDDDRPEMNLMLIFDELNLENVVLAANRANSDREEVTNGFEDNHYIDDYYFGVEIKADEEYYISRIREGVTQEVEDKWKELVTYIEPLNIKRVPDFQLYSNLR